MFSFLMLKYFSLQKRSFCHWGSRGMSTAKNKAAAKPSSEGRCFDQIPLVGV